MGAEQDKPGACLGGDGRWLTTGEMAREAGTTLRTVRFYEAEGLISAQAREDGAVRLFPPAELKKLQIISDLRDAGLSLQDIKDLVGLKATCANAVDAATQMSGALRAQVTELDRRIATLQRVRGELSAMLGALDENCRACTHPEYPKRCQGCNSVSAPAADRPTTLLWRH